MTAPIRSMGEVVDVPVVGEIIAVLRRHQDFAEVFRLMKERWGLTNKFIDDAGGLADGQTDKYLGPSEMKNWGPQTFDLFCEILAVEFHAKIDLAAAQRMQAVWEGRERPLYPDAKVRRISKKLIERAKPHVFSQLGKLSAPARMQCLTAEHRSRIARKAAKARWRKSRATARAAAGATA